ncbi:hypothetical protein EJB05_47028, partial [Eragrostis curvula]
MAVVEKWLPAPLLPSLLNLFSIHQKKSLPLLHCRSPPVTFVWILRPSLGFYALTGLGFWFGFRCSEVGCKRRAPSDLLALSLGLMFLPRDLLWVLQECAGTRCWRCSHVQGKLIEPCNMKIISARTLEGLTGVSTLSLDIIPILVIIRRSSG